jgi:hypothetical protein
MKIKPAGIARLQFLKVMWILEHVDNPWKK